MMQKTKVKTKVNVKNDLRWTILFDVWFENDQKLLFSYKIKS